MSNHLIHTTSPYLLQHAENPVDWYPWGQEAFDRAKNEDKPIFLSIGYSTCHWCHVMAHESFEDRQVADVLNQHFISIKVDKEERPDIDNIYMNVCQLFTGSGGWPTSIFMTPDQKPFFAGTYFPKQAMHGMGGFLDLLFTIHEKWMNSKEEMIKAGDEVIMMLNEQNAYQVNISRDLASDAVAHFKSTFDKTYGGFGSAPKFPAPHNLMFLMDYAKNKGDKGALEMAEKTLKQMYKGGIFDHIGFGFSRYSTDRFWLAPHFEKMLYDNALLTMAYLKAYDSTKNELYKTVAVRTMDYVLRELLHSEGGFYSAQDADSEGVEGKYYLFDYDEITNLLGDEAGTRFNQHYGITKSGNFEGKNIPNLLKTEDMGNPFPEYIQRLYEYRRARMSLHLDDKILTSWSSLMLAAFAYAYRVLGNTHYLEVAEKTCRFIDANLSENDTLYVSFRKGVKSTKGFLDDYAFYSYALIQLFEASGEQRYLDKAEVFCQKAITDFFDTEKGGFYLYGTDAEALIMRPKETYDGAIFSGNSAMAHNLLNLSRLKNDGRFDEVMKKHFSFMSVSAAKYEAGHSFYLSALLSYQNPLKKVVCDDFSCKVVEQPST